jgi:hypothetical protein
MLLSVAVPVPVLVLVGPARAVAVPVGTGQMLLVKTLVVVLLPNQQLFWVRVQALG